MVLMRHGARGPNKSAIPNRALGPWKKDDLAMLTHVGYNQAFLNGANQKMNYPNFLRNVKINEINLNARNIQRTMDTAFTFVDGILDNFRSFHISQMLNKWSWPFFGNKGSKARHCWKRSLWSAVLKSYRNNDAQSHFTGVYDIGLSGQDAENDWEDKAYELCGPVDTKLKSFSKRKQVMEMEMIKYFKSELAKNPKMVEAYEQGGTPIDQMGYLDIKHFSDWCVATNTDGKNLCPANVWRAVQDMYDFKFYGILNKKDNLVCATTFATAFVNVLKDFRANPTGSKEKLHLWVKSDT